MPADWIASSTWPWNCFDRGTSGRRMPSRNQPEARDRPLDRNRVGFEEHRLVQPLQLRVEAAGLVALAGERGVDDGAHLARRDVGGHRHDALVAGQHALARDVVVAAQQRHAPADAGEVLAIAFERGRFLDADDVRQCRRQTLDGLRLQVAGRAARDVVQDDAGLKPARRSPCSADTGLPASACCSTA